MTTRDRSILGIALRRHGVGDPVLLLHSLFFDGSMFDDLLLELAGHDVQHEYLRPDHRGQGASDDGRLDLEHLAEDTAALLEQELGGTPAHVVGSSMGGYVATHLAARHPEAVRTLTLLGGTADAEPEPERFAALELSVRQRSRDAVDALERTMFGDEHLALRLDDPRRARWRRHFARLEPRAADAAHAVFTRTSLHPAFATVTAPVLLIAGASDRTKPPAHMRRMAALKPGARLAVLPGVGHTPAIEKPHAVAALLVEHWRRATNGEMTA